MALLLVTIILPYLLGPQGVVDVTPHLGGPLEEKRRGRITYVIYPDGLTSISANFSIPLENTSSWAGEVGASICSTGGLSLSMRFTEAPWNATDLEFEGVLSDGILLFSGSGSSELPGSPVEEGNLTSLFPINAIVLSLDLRDGSIEGSILVPTDIAQCALEVEFNGTRDNLTFHGSVDVPYGTFIYDGETYEISDDYLRAFLHYICEPLVGVGEGSLYGLTQGALEAVYFNYTLEDKSTYAYIELEMETSGDLLRAVEWLLWDEEEEGLYHVLNRTYAYIEEAHLDASYLWGLNKTYFSLSGVLDTGFLAELPPLLLPSGLGRAMGLLTEAIVNSAEELNISLSNQGDTLEAGAEGFLGEAFEMEVNDLKLDLAENILGELSAWERFFLEDTWLETANLSLNLVFSEGRVQVELDGLDLRPVGDGLVGDSFTIAGLFNFTDSLFLPEAGEMLTIVVVGGHNSTHLVTPIIPEEVPQPDESPSANMMVWWNCTASCLSPLLFRVARDDESPRADGGGDQVVAQGAEVVFNASRSTDNLEISAYLWDFGDGENASGMIVYHRYGESGDYTVVLRVWDATGNVGVDMVRVTVLRDSDGDGLPDVEDPDDDNDGWPDPWDPMRGNPFIPNLLIPPLAIALILLSLRWKKY